MLATVAGVELGSVGYWNISNADDWHPTAEDMAAAVAALDCPAVRRPILKFGHTGEPGEGDPAIGVVDNLRLTEEGQTLVGDFVGVPAWLAEADSEGRSVIASAYPDRSGEWEHDYVCQLGHTHPFVLHAMSLLGVKRPGIGTLESLYDLYTKAPEKEVAMANAPVALAGTTTDEVRKAYYNGPAASNYYLWIREMYVDPPELIVEDDKDDTLLRVPYTVSGDGEVEFGDGQAVKVEYVAARASAGKPAVAFASHAEARPKAATQTPPPVEAEATKEKEITVAKLSEAALQKLGLDAEADDDAVNAAIEALPDQPEAGSGEAAPVEEATPEQIAAAAKKHGLTVYTSEVADRLTADATAGREARDRQQRDDDAKVVDAAISKGKITPSRREHFITLMASDREGTTTLLEKTLQESAVPLTEMGHSTEPVDNPADNPVYKNWSF